MADLLPGLKAKRAELEEKMKAATEDGEQFDKLEAEHTDTVAQIQRIEKVREFERRSAGAADVKPSENGGIKVGDPKILEDPKKGFTDHREFLVAVMQAGAGQREDRRLSIVRKVSESRQRDYLTKELGMTESQAMETIMAAAGSDEASGINDPNGGYLVPVAFLNELLRIGAEGDFTAGRVRQIPMSAPVIEIPARVDKDHSTGSVSGGFTVTRKPETVALASSRAEFELIRLKADNLYGLSFATENILTDSPISFAAIIEAGFRDQFTHHLIGERLEGTGVGEFMGVQTSPALITVSKEGGQAADTIIADNVARMRARCWGYNDAIWVANHDTFPQLYKLSVPVGTGGSVIYYPSMQADRPDALMGRPIFYNEYMATLGDLHDIMLINFMEYLEGTLQPLQSAESIHVRFVNHERTFKFWMRNAGAPWWRSALTPKKSTATLSPFVSLAARA